MDTYIYNVYDELIYIMCMTNLIEASSLAPFSSALFYLPVRDGFGVAVEVDADFHDRQTRKREA